LEEEVDESREAHRPKIPERRNVAAVMGIAEDEMVVPG
jgi:hypothetical protein